MRNSCHFPVAIGLSTIERFVEFDSICRLVKNYERELGKNSLETR